MGTPFQAAHLGVHVTPVFARLASGMVRRMAAHLGVHMTPVLLALRMVWVRQWAAHLAVHVTHVLLNTYINMLKTRNGNENVCL